MYIHLSPPDTYISSPWFAGRPVPTEGLKDGITHSPSINRIMQ
jgi:hypothetical protein